MTFDDKGGGKVNQMMTDDGDGIEKKVKDKMNHQLKLMTSYLNRP